MSILRSLKIYLSRLHYAKIVREYDKKTPLYKNLYSENYLNKNGFKRYEDLSKTQLDILIKHFLKKDDQYFFYSKDLSNVFNCILDDVYEDVLKYLGNDARLDFISLQKTDYTDLKKSVSGSWHTDSVGFRLKCYICLDAKGDQPTYILKNNLNKLYHPSFNEDLRFSGKKNINLLDQQISIFHKTGTINMFDTNLLHRGAYEVSNSSRTVLVLEFSDINKSNKLLKNSYISVPIGTQNKSKIRFTREFLDNFKYFKIINPSLVCVS